MQGQVIPERCSLYLISSEKDWLGFREEIGGLHLGEEDEGVDAGAVGLVHWDRDVQEAVPSSHLIKMVEKEKS